MPLRHAHWSADRAAQRTAAALIVATGALFAAVPHGADIGPMFWLCSALALMLCAATLTVAQARPGLASALYAVMALCQAGNLAGMGLDSTTTLPAWGHAHLESPLNRGFNLATVAAAVHLSCTHPWRLRVARWLPVVTWLFAASVWWLASGHFGATTRWWATHATLLLLSGLAVTLMHRSFRAHPHPFALMMKRFSMVIAGTWLLLHAATVVLSWPNVTTPPPSSGLPLAEVLWQMMFALVLACVPFLAKSRHLARELALFAIIGTLAVVLDLLLVSVFSLHRHAALALALFMSIAVYAGARQWLVSRMLGTRVTSIERLFEQLFRTTRVVETDPTQAGPALSRLLAEVFDPFETTLLNKEVSRAHPLSDGSAMLVPVPAIALVSAPQPAPTAILLRHAQQGRRLFTLDDARLAERIGEQMRRAVAFDQALEQGRSEERRRLAQDLHDDIGARLLTLMYKAPSPDMEDYVRHTLQDLKTLTRGLATTSPSLAHALAEWKADITQRLTAAHITLRWNATQDADVVLTVVQWSALTRMLRELISNILAHAQARMTEIDVNLISDRLVVTVADDGIGRAPEQWAPGLGVGGVRKRVRQLGGEVTWQERLPQGICCRVTVERLSASG